MRTIPHDVIVGAESAVPRTISTDGFRCAPPGIVAAMADRPARVAATGERYADVIMLWVEAESDKLALVGGSRFAVLHHRPFRGPSLGPGAGVWPAGNRQGGID
jgi:hypothetical protein